MPKERRDAVRNVEDAAIRRHGDDEAVQCLQKTQQRRPLVMLSGGGGHGSGGPCGMTLALLCEPENISRRDLIELLCLALGVDS